MVRKNILLTHGQLTRQDTQALLCKGTLPVKKTAQKTSSIQPFSLCFDTQSHTQQQTLVFLSIPLSWFNPSQNTDRVKQREFGTTFTLPVIKPHSGAVGWVVSITSHATGDSVNVA